MLDAETLGLPPEPTAREALRAGADVVTMSGDKLLGGPQAGIILGTAALVARMRENPLCRALRVDKLTLAALEATLALYRDPAVARREIPTLAMLTAPARELAARATSFAQRLERAGIDASTLPGASAVGGGAYPALELPTTLVVVGGPAQQLEATLRNQDPAIVARIQDDRVVLDLRTVLPEEEDAVFAALTHAAR
jgi:L-seryl-tRNA(Ser) seleniumtransferase